MAAAISVIDSDEVLVASIACCGAIRSSFGEQLDLELDALGHRLDHEVGVARGVLERARGAQPLVARGRGVRRATLPVTTPFSSVA